jgi:hypothetical protein
VVNVHSRKKRFGSGRWKGLACDFISSDVFCIIAVEAYGDNISDNISDLAIIEIWGFSRWYT